MKYLTYARIALHIASIVLSITTIGYVLAQRTRCLTEECKEDI